MLAASYLSRPGSSKLFVIGAGRVGTLIPDAYRAVRPIEDRNRGIYPASSRLVRDLANNGFRAKVADDLHQAMNEADIISSATLATMGAWLRRPGTHVDLIGSFTPKMREADDDVFRGASIYIDTKEALHEAGDLAQPIEFDVITESAVQKSLARRCKENRIARRSDDEITCFKAVGFGLVL